MASTFMQEVYRSAREAVQQEPGRSQLKGVNAEAITDTVLAITGALDKLPPTTNLHVLFFSLTYVRNAVGLAMQEANKSLATETGGTG